MPPEPQPSVRHAAKAVERFVFFSDAVFAFSLTLLATGLKLPAHATRLTHAQLLEALGQMVPALFGYLITFGLVARLWVRHHRMFEKLIDYDARLLTLNFGLLLCVSLEPFTIQLLMEVHTDTLPLVIYTGMLALTGVASFLVFWHSRRTPGLIAEPLGRDAFIRECSAELGMPCMASLIFVGSLFLPAQSFGAACGIAGGLTFGGRRLALRLLLRREPAPGPSPGAE